MSAWEQPTWLPELEVCEWPRLRRLREQHRRAVEAWQDSGDDVVAEAALGALCDATETAVRELTDHWDEGEEAYRAARGSLAPPPEPPEQLGSIPLAEFERRGAKATARAAAHAKAIAPKKRALLADEKTLSKLHSMLSATLLLDDRLVCPIVVEVARVRREEAAAA